MSQFSTPTILADRPPYPMNQGVLTVQSLTGLSVKEYGAGALRQTVITYTNFVIPLTDLGSTGCGAVKIASFPKGVISCVGGVQDLTGVATAGGNFQISHGSAATADASLATTEVDICAASSADASNGDSHKTSSSWFNGSVTPTDIYVNAATAGDPGTGATLTINGTVVITWMHQGTR